MKNILLIVLLYSMNMHAQSFGPDKTIFLDSTYEVREQFLDVAFNGWIYNAFNYYTMPFTGYRVQVSMDNGNTWQTLFDFNVPGASGWYPQIKDMLVAGTDTTNLKVVLALLGGGNGGPENYGVVRAYDGISGIATGNQVEMGDFMSYRITDIALATDSKYPLSASSPYAVAVAYTTSDNSGIDSLNYYLSDDGGLNFDGPYWLDSTAGSFGQVDISYGTGQGGSDGRFGLVAERNSHLSVMFTIPGLPSWFTSPVNVDTLFNFTDSICTIPVISMQNSLTANLSGGFSTVIFSIADNPSNATKDLVSFYLPVTPGGTWMLEAVDTTADNSTMPALAYSEHAGGFFTGTFYNSLTTELPFFTRSQDSGGVWIDMFYNYPDTMIFSEPYPATCIGETGGTNAMFSWKQVIDTTGSVSPLEAIKFDMMNLTVGISNQKTNEESFHVFPNPFSDELKISFLNECKNRKIEIVDALGRQVYFKELITTAIGIICLQPGNLPKGIYIIKVMEGNKVMVRKIARQ